MTPSSRSRQLACALLLSVSGCAHEDLPGSPVEAQDGPAVATTTAALTDLNSRANEDTFTAFESGQVRPLALSADGKTLFAVNTPDNRLEIFDATGASLSSLGNTLVGLEPVAIAVRSATEVWVVNHLSDSISIVDVSTPSRPYVKKTLLVGDEPRDIVFARGKAYVTTAHRGQNTGRDPQLTVPSVGRADVWVFDPANLGSALAGTPITVLSLFADTPRALAVSADGNTVYAAAFHSGNRTTTVPERAVTNSGGLPPPLTAANGVVAPWNGLVAKYRVGTPDGQYHWLDELNRVWDDWVKFSLPDRDVFAIDATLAVPAQKPGALGAFASVGTIVFNMAVNPINGRVYVSNLESRNEVRFEGHNATGNGTSVRGHIAESRITVLGSGAAQPRHLNKHVNYAVDGTPAEAQKSLALPTGMAVSADGQFLYVAALGSNKLGIFRTAEIEANTFVPNAADHVTLTGGGPTGVVFDSVKKRAYVLTRFDNGVSVVDAAQKRELSHARMYNPEPASITDGRRFLYDASYTSSHGDSACASCHIFGDFDSLAWDLGDPDGQTVNNPGPFTIPVLPDLMPDPNFHPMKGPMSTQSLRGMANHGPMHWRGDRTGGNDVLLSLQPDVGVFDEVAAFKKFNPAFVGLLGRTSELSAAEMQAFTNFVMQVVYPPNPIRNLDNGLTASQQAGRNFYFNNLLGVELPTDTFHNCNGCHKLDPGANAIFGVKKPGFFGSDGASSFESFPQFFKVPHLRNAYQKVGMFGGPNLFDLPIDVPEPRPPTAAPLPAPFNEVDFKGDQVRGFGYTHSGEADTVYRFLGATLFSFRPIDDQFPNPFGIPRDAGGIQLRRDLEAFVHAYDSNIAPIVGQQVTLTGANTSTVAPRIELMKQRAFAGDCDLIAFGTVAGAKVGFFYTPLTGLYDRDKLFTLPFSEAQVRAQATTTSPITYMAVPRNSGRRIALDRDSDGLPDGND